MTETSGIPSLRTEDRPSPFVTIVVAIRNVAAELKDSLDTFSRQTRRDFEVLIADCNSADDPAQHFAGRDYPITHVVQSDTGIYDAWNKVLPQARGEWLIFLGAGDTFAAADTLEKAVHILGNLPDQVLMAYGQVNVVGENGEVLRQCGAPWPLALAEISRFDMFPHQATFQRRRTLAEYGLFDASYRIAGDTDMILRLAAKHAPFHFDLTVANFRYGGTSSSPNGRLSSIREMIRVMKAHGVPNRSTKFLVKAATLDLMNRLLPERVLHRMINFYRVVTGRKARYRF